MKIYAPAFVLGGLTVLVALGRCEQWVQATGVMLLLLAVGLAVRELVHCYTNRHEDRRT